MNSKWTMRTTGMIAPTPTHHGDKIETRSGAFLNPNPTLAGATPPHNTADYRTASWDHWHNLPPFPAYMRDDFAVVEVYYSASMTATPTNAITNAGNDDINLDCNCHNDYHDDC